VSVIFVYILYITYPKFIKIGERYLCSFVSKILN